MQYPQRTNRTKPRSLETKDADGITDSLKWKYLRLTNIVTNLHRAPYDFPSTINDPLINTHHDTSASPPINAGFCRSRGIILMKRGMYDQVPNQV
jgi:hypothetical protein